MRGDDDQLQFTTTVILAGIHTSHPDQLKPILRRIGHILDRPAGKAVIVPDWQHDPQPLQAFLERI